MLGAIPWLDLNFDISVVERLWGARGFRQTAWLFVLLFSSLGVTGAVYWKPGSTLFRGIVITLSVLGFIEGLLWLLIVLLFIGGIPGLP